MAYEGYPLRKTKEEQALSQLRGPALLGCENPSPRKAQASVMQSPRSGALPLQHPGREPGLEVHGSAELSARPLGPPLPQRGKSEAPERLAKGGFGGTGVKGWGSQPAPACPGCREGQPLRATLASL